MIHVYVIYYLRGVSKNISTTRSQKTWSTNTPHNYQTFQIYLLSKTSEVSFTVYKLKLTSWQLRYLNIQILYGRISRNRFLSFLQNTLMCHGSGYLLSSQQFLSRQNFEFTMSSVRSKVPLKHFHRSPSLAKVHWHCVCSRGSSDTLSQSLIYIEITASYKRWIRLTFFTRIGNTRILISSGPFFMCIFGI